MFSIAICDDEKMFAEKFKSSLSELFIQRNIDVEIYRCKSGEELIDLYNTKLPDVIFLDIDMPGQDGFQVAKTINKEYGESIIVFCSNHNELVYDSFEYQPFWFLRKEDYEKRLDGVVEKIIDKIKEKNDEFVLKHKEELLRIRYKEVIYVEVYKHKLQFHQIDKSIETRGNLSDVESRFLEKNFVKINSGCIVNLNFIYKIQDNQVILNTKEVLVISRSRKASVKEAFFSYLERK